MNRLAVVLLISLAAFLSLSSVFAAEDQQKPSKSIQQAASDGDIEQVRLHISKGTDLNQKDRTGRTALHYAARKGARDVVELLISKNVDINAQDRNGWTALHEAAYAGDRDVVQLLVSSGADVNAKNKTSQTPLDMASSGPRRNPEEHEQLVEFLREHGAETGRPPVPDERMPGLERGVRMPDLYPGYQDAGPRGHRGRTIAEPNAEPDILADPNEIRARIKTFEGLAEALERLDKTSRFELREWLETREDNRIRLARAVEIQVKKEADLVHEVAEQEKAKKTTAVIDKLLSDRRKRLINLVQRIEEDIQQMRPMRGSRGRYSGRYSGPTQGYQQDQRTRRRMPRGRFRPQDELTTEENPSSGYGRITQDANDVEEAHIQQWLDTSPDDKMDLLRVVHDQVRAQFVAVRKVALEEEAKKTTAAIEGVLLNRQERFTRLTERMERDSRDRLGGYPGQGYQQDRYLRARRGQTPVTGQDGYYDEQSPRRTRPRRR
jgi:hypothetical protein